MGQQGVNYLGYHADGTPYEGTDYFAALIAYLQGTGYVVGQNLFAAPYDWRLTANPHGFNGQLKTLIENAYAANQNTPVFTLCHSMYVLPPLFSPSFSSLPFPTISLFFPFFPLPFHCFCFLEMILTFQRIRGNLEFSTFMLDQTPEWKDQYIGGYIAAAAPWSGASLALRAIISGLEIKYGLLTIPPTLVANLVRTFGSGNIFLLHFISSFCMLTPDSPFSRFSQLFGCCLMNTY